MIEIITLYASVIAAIGTIVAAILAAIMAWPSIRQILCRHRWCDSFKREYREFCSKCGKKR